MKAAFAGFCFEYFAPGKKISGLCHYGGGCSCYRQQCSQELVAFHDNEYTKL
jgi:hypothetical protein